MARETVIIKDEDLKVVQGLADKYGISVVDFGKRVVTQTKKVRDRQFRVTDEEYNLILNKSKALGMSLSGYCEYACGVFLKDKVINKSILTCKSYGYERVKRIGVIFVDKDIENGILKVAEDFSLQVASLLRYCALNG